MMKYALALALMGVPAAAMAQSPDQGPVVVEIAATGQVVVPAQRFRFEVKLSATGADEQAAGAALAAKRAKLVGALAGLGVTEAQPETGSGGPSLVNMLTSLGGRGKPSFSTTSLDTSDGDGDGDETPQSTASESVTVDAPSRNAVDNARRAVEAQEASMDGEVIALLNDYTAPTRQAKADAIAKARAEASAYAATLGLRRVAIVKVSERQDLVAGTMAFVTQVIGMFAPKNAQGSDTIPVQANLMVEFQLSR
jgi:uncharacterized protein YggE